MIETLATLALGTASSLIANIIDRKLPASSEKQLKKEFDSALTEAAAHLAERHPNLVPLREQVLNLLPISSEDFLPFLNSLAAGESVNQPELLRPVRRRIDSARDGSSVANYIGLFRATDIEFHDLLVDYVRLIDQRVSYKPQLRSYYVFLLSKRLTVAVESASSEASAALGEIREALHRLEEINRRLVIVHAVRPDAGEFVPYSPDEQKGRALRYFAGRAPSWQDAATDFGIKRERWCKNMRASLEQVTESKALLVSAVAGAGKSTEIKRLALGLAREGKFTVYELRYFGADTARLLAEIEDVVSSEPEDRILMMLADGAAAHLDTLKEVALRVRDRRPIAWVLSDRTERWADALEHPPGETKPVELGVDVVEHVPLLHLTSAEILALADHLVGWEILSEETSREKWAERFEQSGPVVGDSARYPGRRRQLQSEAAPGSRAVWRARWRACRWFGCAEEPLPGGCGASSLWHLSRAKVGAAVAGSRRLTRGARQREGDPGWTGGRSADFGARRPVAVPPRSDSRGHR